MTSKKTFKRWFKKTKLGRFCRHIRNFFWRLSIDSEQWRRIDPEGWQRHYNKYSYD